MGKFKEVAFRTAKSGNVKIMSSSSCRSCGPLVAGSCCRGLSETGSGAAFAQRLRP